MTYLHWYQEGQRNHVGGKATPWGISDYEVWFSPRIFFANTPRHGGLGIRHDAASDLLTEAAQERARVQGVWLWYEEDCDINIPLWELPQLRALFLSARDDGRDPVDVLHESLSYWHSDYLLAVDVAPEPKAFARWQTRKRTDEMRAARHPDLIVSAASTHPHRPAPPDGMIFVHTADGRVHTVLRSAYRRLLDKKQDSDCLLLLSVVRSGGGGA